MRPSDALIDEIAVGCRCETNTDPEQRIEGAARVSPPVPADFGAGRAAIIRSGGSNEGGEGPEGRIRRDSVADGAS